MDQYTVSYSTIKESQHLSRSVSRFVFTTCSPHTVNYHAPATPPKCLSSPSSPIGKLCSFWKVRVKMLLIDCMLHTVALNYSLSRHTEDVRQIYNNNNNIYEKSTVQLASVGLAQAHPNND